MTHSPNPSDRRPALRVVLVDDHAVVRDGVEAMLRPEKDITVVAHASTGEEAVAVICAHHPDVAMVDVRLPKGDGFWVVETVLQKWPEARILLFSANTPPQDLKRARIVGARGLLPKTVSRKILVEALRRIHAGAECFDSVHAEGAVLSARECEVLDHIRQGRTNADIALALGISEHTVKTHVKAILAKLEAADRAEAVTRGFELGLLSI